MREIAPFGLRMPPDLKARLTEVARQNGRSLNTEVIARLEASLKDVPGGRVAMSPVSDYGSGAMSQADREMLEVFRAMPASKQLALLSLFR